MHRITVNFRTHSTPAERAAALVYLRRIPGVHRADFVTYGCALGEPQRQVTVLVEDAAAAQWFVPEVARLTAVESARAEGAP